ncbi:PTS fructose transporter subunit IIA [Sulfurifustis variabilis]|uniref:PTS fructose transporter subunit IIA n=1 Tax=Sulfurifustis variabilis TaxID=1675686 RepID=A0A1B4VD12_9GAMM|nr:PTS fructose transporter subunit IIA [Sulfurifustis variabilis]BAU47197.1 PTS fructose transporter subunit IIA [Sulfurifustis variabilis]
MIGLLILAQKDLAAGLLESAVHTLGERPTRLEAVGVDYAQPPEAVDELLKQRLAEVNDGDGVLIFADVYGATHTNLACRLLERGRIELIAGVNVPMLLRALNYRHLPLPELIERALTGGSGGILCPGNSGRPSRPRTEARP